MKRSVLTLSLAAVLGLSLVATDALAQRRGGGGGGGFRAGGHVGGGGLGGGGFRAGGGFRGGGFRGGAVAGGVRGPAGYRGGYAYRGGHWGGRRYWGVGAGLVAGAIVGSQYPYYYDDYDGAPVTYGYSAPGYDAPGYDAPDVDETSVAACAQRFRSYNPATGTYRGYDGLDHPCP